jgi:hypothetical protein
MYSASNLMPRQRSNDKCETGNPLAGLSGLSRRSFNEGGSAASAKKCEMINE